MHCPFCQSQDTNVIDSRDTENGAAIRRRRSCGGCDRRFTTYEHVDLQLPKIIKRDGTREDYDEQKISRSMHIALRKRKVTTESVQQAITRIRTELMTMGEREVPSRTVGELLMRELHALDAVAFVRFASVYKDFRDVEDFADALKAYFSTEPLLPGLEQK